MKKIVIIMLSLFALGTLSACNTVEGFGKDVQKVGGKMEDAAKK